MDVYQGILNVIAEKQKGLAILVDPDKFLVAQAAEFIAQIPEQTTHLFVGGSSVLENATETVVCALKSKTTLPLLLFPGDYTQLTPGADALLFLSLISGRNVEYLIEQQLKAVSFLKAAKLEVIPTGYILIDGGNESAVARVSKTLPMSQDHIELIVETALAGQYMGAKLIYLEAGSGALFPVKPDIIAAVKKEIDIPIVVGGGVRRESQWQSAYKAGADMVVMGTAFEK